MPERFNSEFWDYVDKLFSESKVIVDRPKDSPHPDYEDVIYPLDYGYLAGTTSSDGAGIDVWMGTNGDSHVNAVICTVDLVKRDSEIKLLFGCSESEMGIITEFLNHSNGMRGLLVRRNA